MVRRGKTLRRTVLEQWRWEHERDQLAIDNAAELAKETRERERDAAEHERLARVRAKDSLAELGRMHDLLFDLRGLISTKQTAELEGMLRKAARSLAEAPRAPKPQKLAAIEKLAEAINAWNDRRNVLETPEREALATAIDDIGHAAGLRGHDLAGPWRDW